MFYQKNVPGFERFVRVAMGLAMAGAGIFGLHGGVAGYGLAAMGAMAALTGFIGFCPACAMVGRKLKQG
jgi:hypothetical protein